MTPDPQIARLEYTIREQMTLMEQMQAEIDRLVDWIMGDKDALTTLQNVYLDPKETAGNRIKAAASAIGYERPKMTPTNLVVIDFRERVRQARLKARQASLSHCEAFQRLLYVDVLRQQPQSFNVSMCCCLRSAV